MYTPLQIKAKVNMNRYASTMPISGENLSAFSALLKPDYATEITNYVLNSPGRLVKRGGQKKVFDQSTADPILLDDRYTPTVRVVCYGTSEIKQEINLNKIEREAVINNPEAIKEVIVRHIADIEEKLDQETANNPYPPIIASEEERMAILSFSRTDIKNQKDKFKKERTDNPGINVVVDASL